MKTRRASIEGPLVYSSTSGLGGQPRMGWRKLTIQDGDLARCSDLSATEQVRRTPTLGILNCGSISERRLV